MEAKMHQEKEQDQVLELGAATELTLGEQGGPYEDFVIPDLED
jgi:hypothetical protein